MKWFKRYFLTGLIAVTPVVLTGWILWRFYRFVDNMLRPHLERIVFLRDSVPDVLVTFLGILAFLGSILVIGLFTRNLLGAAFFTLVERLFTRIPIVKGIFSVTKQISEVLLTDTSRAFKRVVVFPYPCPETYAIGFVTYDDPQRGSVNIFLPTTPNPTSGFMLMVPRDRIRILPLSVEEGIKLVISGGSVVPAADDGMLDKMIADLSSGPNADGKGGDADG